MNRVACLTAALVAGSPALGRAVTMQKVISLEGCSSVQAMPAWLGSQIPPMDLDDYLVANDEQTAIYLCDADLPDTATAFDSVGLEYIGGYQAVPPEVVAYANEEVQGYNGNRYSWVGVIGSCNGAETPGAIMVPGQGPPIFQCWTARSLSWASNPGQAWDDRLSIFFLVVVPVWNPEDWGSTVYGPMPWNASPQNEVFRLIVQYEQ